MALLLTNCVTDVYFSEPPFVAFKVDEIAATYIMGPSSCWDCYQAGDGAHGLQPAELKGAVEHRSTDLKGEKWDKGG